MKTLGKQLTRNFFNSEEGFTQLEKNWSEAINSKDKTLNCEHHLLYQVLRGKNWTKGFAEITNENKINCSEMSRDRTIKRVFNSLYYSTAAYEHPVFKDLITPSTRTLVKDLTIDVLNDTEKVYKDMVVGV